MNIPSQSNFKSLWSLPVIVAALGYFVDIYDLLLFGIVRLPSLKDLGLSEAAVSSVGKDILNWQSAGLLLGGILWGILGDKRGRLSVLFGSIITYSLMNIACGFVQDVQMYKAFRFVAGIGLAGELGAGITLVSEILPKKLRAIGTSLVAGVGLLGAVVAYFTVQFFTWRVAFFVGGGLGIMLLLLRIGVFESGMYKNVADNKNIKRGDFRMFFNSSERFGRYIRCIFIGLPTWFVIGLLASFSNEFGAALGITEKITPGLAIMWCYVGLSAGDLFSGFLSHRLASRKKAVTYMMIFTALVTLVYLYGGISNAKVFYTLCLMAGFGIGYWAMFVTIAAEQFGTNLRSTAATTVPNMVRGMVIPMTSLYAALKPANLAPSGVINAGAIVGLIAFILGFWAIFTISETHDKDLDFNE
jgi:predicted MFS family arabinose efflux permease